MSPHTPDIAFGQPLETQIDVRRSRNQPLESEIARCGGADTGVGGLFVVESEKIPCRRVWLPSHPGRAGHTVGGMTQRDDREPEAPVVAVVLAAGFGTRFDPDNPKQLVSVDDKPIVCWSIEAFEQNPHVTDTIVVVNPQVRDEVERLVDEAGYPKVRMIIDGGAERADSIPAVFTKIHLHFVVSGKGVKEKQVAKAVESVGGQLLITADHGNAEQMRDPATGQAHTAHTNLPVPLIYVGDKSLKAVEGGKLSDIAPTMLSLMGMPIPEEMTGKPLFIVE